MNNSRMVNFRRFGSAVKSGKKLGSLTSLTKFSSSKYRPDPSAFKKLSKGFTFAGSRSRSAAGSAAGNGGKAAQRGVGNVRGAAASSSKKITKSASNKADEVIDSTKTITKNKTVMRRMGEACANNPLKCTAGMALAGYTAVNLVENSRDQQECIVGCLPANWPVVVDSNGEVEPDYFPEDPKPPTDGVDEHTQPQCMEGTDCETYCVAACKAEHPTTVLGAAMEGATELFDDVILPVVEDVLGIPIGNLGGGVLWGIRIAALVIGFLVVTKIGTVFGLFKNRPKYRKKEDVRVTLNIPEAPRPVAPPVARPVLPLVSNPSLS